ncbi:hypothetical protein H6G48_25085 [Microcystis flos-aquae FACHB-1344]|uniref:Uncharacterized protein n=1 Tax=Microcystis flos-aquae FACHB-1344 TaxID=2692899 RepID=A0ABR8I0Y5_9CHRO|nr:hypothetical protein [Microcystis flos-aquae]MBD2624748.1 hypothetical protein [Microcystis flos-aquae FACHB-1344]
MSKVISFSISDRYLDKLRSLYPELTENLAAKQFLIDQLDAGLDNNLDDKLRILIEKSLEDSLDAKLDDRLDATEKSISKWILDFDNRIKDIDREIKDRSIAIDHQIKAIEARLDESLDTNLDDGLDDSLDSSLYESYSEIFNDRPDEDLDDSLDNELDDKLDNTLDDNLDKSLDDATIDKKHGQSIEPDGQWLTLKEILGQRRKDWPKSIEGLRKKAIREGWPRRDRENRKEYQIP